MTLKENFIPWRRNIGKGWWFEPLECSLYFNTVFGHDFWTKQPTKYESGYYPFSTRIRPNIALGERFKYDIPHNKRKRIKSITFSMSWVQQISTLCVSTVMAMPVSGMSSASLSVPRCSTFKPRTG